MREPARILIVEDDPEWQEVLGQILERDGYLVDTARTYQEAVHKITAQTYQLAVIDIRLDALDPKDIRGMYLLNAIKQIGEEVYSIVVTAYGTVELASQAFRDYGVLDFMDKGFFDSQEFRTLVQKALTSLIYMVVQIDYQPGKKTLKIGGENVLIVSTQAQKPTSGAFSTVSLPETGERVELEIAIIAPDMEVLPGSRQYLEIFADGTSEPVNFKLVPEKKGKTEVVIEVYYRERWLRRLKLEVDVLEAQ